MMVSAAKSAIYAQIDELWGEVADELSHIPSLTLEQKKQRISIFAQGLITAMQKGVCHGDIKPSNILWDKTRFDISDLGGSKLIQDLLGKMNSGFPLDGEQDRNKLNTLAGLLTSPNTARLEAVCKVSVKQIEMLLKWKIITKKEGALPVVLDDGKLKKLRDYLKTEFLPAKTEGYACNAYTTAMSDYFWRGEVDNFKKAAHALDIRASGITLYQVLTGKTAPLGRLDNVEYYSKFKKSLDDLDISNVAIDILCRMAEPNCSETPKVFNLPVSEKELEVLTRL